MIVTDPRRSTQVNSPQRTTARERLTLLELLLALSIAAAFLALAQVHVGLPLVGLPFLLFGLPIRIWMGNRDGWVIGAYAGSVFVVVMWIAWLLLGYAQQNPVLGFSAMGVAIGVGLCVCTRQSRALTTQLIATTLTAISPMMAGFVVGVSVAIAYVDLLGRTSLPPLLTLWIASLVASILASATLQRLLRPSRSIFVLFLVVIGSCQWFATVTTMRALVLQHSRQRSGRIRNIAEYWAKPSNLFPSNFTRIIDRATTLALTRSTKFRAFQHAASVPFVETLTIRAGCPITAKQFSRLHLGSVKRFECGSRTDIGDKDLSQLNFSKLEFLILSGERFTDEAVERLPLAKDLSTLGLPHTNITSKVIKVLPENIEVLDLQGCVGVTDEAVQAIEQLPNLKSVQLCGSGVTVKRLTESKLLSVLDYNAYAHDADTLSKFLLATQDFAEVPIQLECASVDFSRDPQSVEIATTALRIKGLRSLSVPDTELNDEFFSAVANTKDLGWLWIDGNQLTEDRLALIRPGIRLTLKFDGRESSINEVLDVMRQVMAVTNRPRDSRPILELHNFPATPETVVPVRSMQRYITVRWHKVVD